MHLCDYQIFVRFYLVIYWPNVISNTWITLPELWYIPKKLMMNFRFAHWLSRIARMTGCHFKSLTWPGSKTNPSGLGSWAESWELRVDLLGAKGLMSWGLRSQSETEEDRCLQASLSRAWYYASAVQLVRGPAPRRRVLPESVIDADMTCHRPALFISFAIVLYY